MALTASPALAVKTHPYTGLSFGPDGTTATSFVNAQGLTIDQGTGNVYVLDVSGSGKVYKFDAAGNPVNFSSLSGNVIEGVGGGNFGGEQEIAIAPSGAPGGTAGDIYVANNGGAIKIYASSGVELGELSGGGETCGVAVDPAGHLFLGVYPSTVKEFVPSANPVTGTDQSGESTASLPGICNVAADGLGNVYATNFAGSKIAKLAGVADTSPTTIEPGGRTLTIDPSSNDLYVDRESVIDQYSAAGALISTSGSGQLSGSYGVAVNGTSGEVYANGFKGKVAVFGAVTVVPTVTSEDATGIGARKATLHGTVNPDGVATTGCKFEYGTTGAYGKSVPCSEVIPTDSNDHPVSAEVGGLLPETTYHFRISAENANGANGGADATFKTGEMVVTGEGKALGGGKAELTGTVLPEGALITECRFEYGDTTNYGQSVACAESSEQIGEGNQPVSVHAVVPGLQSSTTYHFRLAAKSEELAQVVRGKDAIFTTSGPLIETSAVNWNGIATTAGSIEATINPQGEGTSYRVEYITQEQFEESGFAGASQFPSGTAGIGHGNNGVEVSPRFPGLQPATAYVARIVATNISGTAYGETLRFATYPDYGSLGSCPQNEQFRVGPSAALPDCRAYEQASEVNKNGSDIRGTWTYSPASRSGDAIAFKVQTGVPGGVGASEFPTYVSRRGSDNWFTRGTQSPPSFGQRANTRGYSSDLRLAFNLVSNFDDTGSHQGTVIRDLLTGTFQSPYPFAKGTATFAGASDDDTKVFFELKVPSGTLPVTSGPTPATGKSNLYVFDRETNSLTLVGALPASEGGEAPTAGSFAGPFDWFTELTNEETLARGGSALHYFTQSHHAISVTGDKAFFTAGDTGQIYARLGLDSAPPETVRISASHRSTPDAEKPAAFLQATPSGSAAFFSSCQKLTEDSTAVHTSGYRCNGQSQGADLYRWQANGINGCEEAEGCLTDITVDGTDPKGAQIQGMIGTSEDGENVYFVANGVLASNQGSLGSHATLGDCREFEISFNGTLTGQGSCNLYLWHDDGTAQGETTFIAPLSNQGSFGFNDVPDWAPFEQQPNGFVSADGTTLVFRSGLKQTTMVNDEGEQFYRYSVGEPELACITCNPTGGPSDAHLTSQSFVVENARVQASLQRNLSADGSRFFFESTAKLVPADTNGDAGCLNEASIYGGRACQDVYEWEADGSGSCHTSSGCYYLLTDGADRGPFYFSDASESGNDVFIFTRSKLVPQDTDTLQDLYDTRVGGGLAAQHQVSPPPCEGEGCRGAGTSAGPASGAGTAVFEGPGNPTHQLHCKKGRVKRHGQCVKQSRRKHRKQQSKRAHRAANHNRRAAR